MGATLAMGIGNHARSCLFTSRRRVTSGFKSRKYFIGQTWLCEISGFRGRTSRCVIIDREAKVISKGVQDNHFISPEKSLSNYNAGQSARLSFT